MTAAHCLPKSNARIVAQYQFTPVYNSPDRLFRSSKSYSACLPSTCCITSIRHHCSEILSATPHPSPLRQCPALLCCLPSSRSLHPSMDIRKWLQETSTPAQPPSPLPQRHEPLLSSPERPRPGIERESDRDRITSDSSLLQLTPRLAKATSLDQESAVEEDEAKSEEHARSDASHPTSCSQSSHPYRRRARHKTRPERYEPDTAPAKKRGSRTLQKRKDESNKEKRKPRRTKSSRPSRPDKAVLQNFHANNVPTDRLTVTSPTGQSVGGVLIIAAVKTARKAGIV